MTKVISRISFTPDTSLLGKIGMGNFKAAEAIAELIANSFDARIFNEDSETFFPLTVEVFVEANKVMVRDNGKGMSAEVLQGALTLAKDMDKVTGNQRSRMGLFGLGMKSASSSLGKSWSIVTRISPDASPIGVTFDLDAFANSQEWAEDLYEIQPGDENPLEGFEHGTAIVISNLHHRSPETGPIFALLGTAYKPLIGAENRIEVNGEAVLPKPYSLVDGSRVNIDSHFGPEDKWHAHGWVGLDTKTHNKGDYGLQLYREGQLIELWNKDFFKAHLMTSRVVGELHLDFVPTNYHKKGFHTESLEWLAAKKAMTEALKPVAKASGDMAGAKNDPQRVAKAIDGLKRAATTAPDIASINDSQEPESKSVPHEKIEITGTGFRIGDRFVELSWEFEEWGEEEQILWDYIYDPDAVSLQAVINSSSELYLATKDLKVLGVLALADVVARYLIDEEKMPADTALSIRDEWILKAVAK